MVLIDFIDDPVEAQKWSIDDTDVVGFNEFALLTGSGAARIDLLQQFSDFFIRYRSRLCPAADKAGDLGGFLDHLKRFIGHWCFQRDEDIAGEKFPPRGPPLAALDTDG